MRQVIVHHEQNTSVMLELVGFEPGEFVLIDEERLIEIIRVAFDEPAFKMDDIIDGLLAAEKRRLTRPSTPTPRASGKMSVPIIGEIVEDEKLGNKVINL